MHTMNSIERLGLWDKFINMRDKYNIMNFKSIQIDFLNFNNAYKDSVLLYLSGSKLNTRVYVEAHTPRSTVSDHKVTVKENLIKLSNYCTSVVRTGYRGVFMPKTHPVTMFQP